MTTVSEGDRELLEFAAKAAGYEAVRPATFGMGCWMALSEGEWQPWNPLADDGDAFRLAVKLGLFWSPVFSHFLSLERFAHQDRDDCYAHRRAVVRAAASIGKEKQ